MSTNFRAALERLIEQAEYAVESGDTGYLLADITAARAALAAEPEEVCPGCEGTPAASNSPCAVCGHPATPPAPEVVGEVGEVGELVAELEQWASYAAGEGQLADAKTLNRAAALLQRQAAPAPVVVPVAVSDALIKAECALSDIAEGEETNAAPNTFEWAKQRCAEALAIIRPVMKLHKIRTSEWPPQPLPQAGEGEA
jgi:hypothetical protein